MADIQGELNRLAGSAGLAIVGAANRWANTNGLTLLGALNAKAGTSGLSFNAVCNALAGTTGRDGAGALSAVVVVTAPTTAPGTPTATANAGRSATVSFSLVSGATTYRATSTPGGFTATGTGSPLTVTNLTTATSYTFKVAAGNSAGYGPESAASNSVTALV